MPPLRDDTPIALPLDRWLRALSDVREVLDCDGLARLAGAAPDDLAHAVAPPGPDERRSYRALLRTHAVEAWVIHWAADGDTGFHDHDLSDGAVRVLRGALAEESLELGRGLDPRRRLFRAGATFSFDASHIHRMRHVAGPVATSVHLYSPPLRRMGCYEVDGDGALRRRSVAADTELRAAVVAAHA